MTITDLFDWSCDAIFATLRTAAVAFRDSHLDELTRAHIEALGEVARQALDARASIGVK